MSVANMLKIGATAAIGSLGVVAGLRAEPLSAKECRAEFRATLAASAPGNATWEQFRRANCASTAQVVARKQVQTEDAGDVSATHIAQCMQDWDAATHMTKQEWARTCRRVVKNRIEFRLDQTK